MDLKVSRKLLNLFSLIVKFSNVLFIIPVCSRQVRNTIKYIASKNQKEFMKELKPVYQASTEEAGLLALDKLEE